ncbi:MAG TPA: transposase [Verrucomicrobiae bacterium]|nr:transposase [Verrucomicrobiae bacterium]
MTRERRHFSPQEKVKILREHLVDHKSISEVCEKHEIQPSLFYTWQKTFFENGAAAFEAVATPGRVSVEQKKIQKLEAKLQRKDEVMAELLTEHILLKKEIGES